MIAVASFCSTLALFWFILFHSSCLLKYRFVVYVLRTISPIWSLFQEILFGFYRPPKTSCARGFQMRIYKYTTLYNYATEYYYDRFIYSYYYFYLGVSSSCRRMPRARIIVWVYRGKCPEIAGLAGWLAHTRHAVNEPSAKPTHAGGKKQNETYPKVVMSMGS